VTPFFPRIDFKDECVDNCVVVAAVANLATDSATSSVCVSHSPRQTTKWLAYGCHTSVLLFDWCIPFLVLFQLCDVPQTLNIQQLGEVIAIIVLMSVVCSFRAPYAVVPQLPSFCYATVCTAGARGRHALGLTKRFEVFAANLGQIHAIPRS